MTAKKVCALVTVLFMVVSAAHAEDFDFKKTFQKIDSVQRVPITGLVMVGAGGKYYLISDNGRFAILNGKLFDIWMGQEINKPSDLEKADRIPLDKLGINQDELSTLTLGTGPEIVTVFMDPTCPHCHNLLLQAENLKSKYTFKLVLLPLLGERATEITKKLVCDKNKQVSLNAVLTASYDGLPAAAVDCDLTPLKKAIVASQVIGINGVPFVVAQDGSVSKGEISDMGAYLSEHKK